MFYHSGEEKIPAMQNGMIRFRKTGGGTKYVGAVFFLRNYMKAVLIRQAYL